MQVPALRTAIVARRAAVVAVTVTSRPAQRPISTPIRLPQPGVRRGALVDRYA
jgi:hypothetical protein